MATTLFVRHQVSDYANWREVYNEVAPLQKHAGVLSEDVYRNEEEPNDITVTHDFATLADAKAFVQSPELHEAMGRAGVLGAPTVWFANRS
jgi:hypothetical protein